MNSMRHLRDAVDYEFQRQVACIRSGEEIISETRLFDPATGRTIAMRTKEELNDYRYFPDPDLSHIVLSEAWLEGVRQRMPMTPQQYRTTFIEAFGLPDYDAAVLSAEPETAIYMDQLCRHDVEFKAASNWMMGPVRSWLNEHPGKPFPIAPVKMAELLRGISEGTYAHHVAAKQIFPALLDRPASALADIVKELGLSDGPQADDLKAIVADVLRIYPLKVEEYRKGKKGILSMFMGEVMKRTGGKADPRVCTDLIRQALETN